jgi:hypothetical protein
MIVRLSHDGDLELWIVGLDQRIQQPNPEWIKSPNTIQGPIMFSPAQAG